MFCKICRKELQKHKYAGRPRIYCKKCAKEVNRKKERERLKRKRSLGTGRLYGHFCGNFEKEEYLIHQEKLRLGLR